MVIATTSQCRGPLRKRSQEFRKRCSNVGATSASEPSCPKYFGTYEVSQSQSDVVVGCVGRLRYVSFKRGEWRAQCGDFGNLQEIFARVGEWSHGSRGASCVGRLTWCGFVVPVVDGPGRVAIGLTVHGRITVSGHCDAVLDGDGVIVDAAVGGQLGEGAQRPVMTGRVLSADVIGS